MFLELVNLDLYKEHSGMHLRTEGSLKDTLGAFLC